MYLQSTSSTHGHYIWILANGSEMICQPLGHLLGPRSSHMGLGIWIFPMSDLIFMYLVLKKKKSTKTTPSDRVPYSGRAPWIFNFVQKKRSNPMSITISQIILFFCRMQFGFLQYDWTMNKKVKLWLEKHLPMLNVELIHFKMLWKNQGKFDAIFNLIHFLWIFWFHEISAMYTT